MHGGFFISMLSTWQQQLQALMDTLNSTEPHYIRCVKPNNVLKPAIFENVNVMQQLRCGVSDLEQSTIVRMVAKFKYIYMEKSLD